MSSNKKQREKLEELGSRLHILEQALLKAIQDLEELKKEIDEGTNS